MKRKFFSTAGDPAGARASHRSSHPHHVGPLFTARRLFSKEPAVPLDNWAIPRAAHTLAMLLLLLTPTASEPSAGFDVVVDDAAPCARVDGPGSGGPYPSRDAEHVTSSK